MRSRTRCGCPRTTRGARRPPRRRTGACTGSGRGRCSRRSGSSASRRCTTRAGGSTASNPTRWRSAGSSPPTGRTSASRPRRWPLRSRTRGRAREPITSLRTSARGTRRRSASPRSWASACAAPATRARAIPRQSSCSMRLPRRGPTLAGFIALGLFWGAWAAVLPSVQEATGTSKGALGLAMLFVSVGSIPSMFFLAAPAVRRFGARAVAIGCGVFALATTLPGLATTLPVLILTLTLAGVGSGIVDVGINANVGRIESETGARLMPLAHGLYSVGVLVGAVGAGLARGAGADREAILGAVAAVIALTGVVIATDDAQVQADPSPGLRLARALLLVGFVGAAAFVVEGGIESWSALFLERELHAEPAVSGLGPGVFGASMALGRFWGQAAVRFSDRLLL